MSELGGVRRLVLKTNHFKHLDCWPPIVSVFKRLEDLSIDFGATNVVQGNFVAAISSWPKTIKSLYLSFRGSEKCWNDIEPTQYFPNLEKLSLEGWTGFKPETMRKMPPGLTSFTMILNSSSTIDALVSNLPADFKELSVPYNNKMTEAGFRNLPRSLLSLEIANDLTPELVTLLPPGLTHLSFSSPQNFRQLLPLLPKSLLSLDIRSGYSDTHTIDASDLPPKLTSFTAQYAITHFKIADLPRTMKTLVLNDPKALTEFQHLPPNLKSLYLRQSGHLAEDGFMDLLPRSLTLFAVEMSPYYGRSAEHLITNEGLKNLPPHLRRLDLPKCKLVTGECFVYLPRTLEHLDLQSSVDVQDHHIADLPKFLQSLYLHSAKDLTNGCARLLPRTLTTLFINESPHFDFACVPDLPLFMSRVELGQNGVAAKYFIERSKRSRTYFIAPKKDIDEE